MPSPMIEMAAAILRQRREAADALGLSLHQRRAAFEKNAEVTLALTDIDATPVELGGIACERLNGAATGGRLLYLHGGGYCVGSPRTHRELAGRIARAARRVAIVPDYRLAPDHPFPAGLDDALAVWRALLAEDATPPMLAGDSAGAGLALGLLVRLRDLGLPLPPRVGLMSPWTDLTLSGASMRDRATRDPYLSEPVMIEFATAYAARDQWQHPEASPHFADLSGLPPMWVQVGSEEVLYNDATRLVAQATLAGVEAMLEVGEGLFHVWQGVPTAPESIAATTRLGTFLRTAQA